MPRCGPLLQRARGVQIIIPATTGRPGLRFNVDHQHQAARLGVIVGGMMRDAAMQHPLARLGGDPFHIIAFPRRDGHRILGQLGRLRHRVAVGGDDRERRPVQVAPGV